LIPFATVDYWRSPKSVSQNVQESLAENPAIGGFDVLATGASPDSTLELPKNDLRLAQLSPQAAKLKPLKR
jgi:hypothetical protein